MNVGQTGASKIIAQYNQESANVFELPNNTFSAADFADGRCGDAVRAGGG